MSNQALLERKAKYRSRRAPYSNLKPRKAAKTVEMSLDDNVLRINSDGEDDLLRSNSESSLTNVSGKFSSDKNEVNVGLAKNEMLTLLKEIRDSQTDLCTKFDLQKYNTSINNRFSDVEDKISSNVSAITTMESRISSIEAAMDVSKHEAELVKQGVLAKNVSILGIPHRRNEDLTSIAVKLFTFIGCDVLASDIFGCYRVRNGNAWSNICIVKFHSFGKKGQVLRAKGSREVRLSDVSGSSQTSVNPMLYINNHVTPHFGKLLAEGRKAVKERKVHSSWLSKYGCQVRFEDNGKESVYRSIRELNELISRYEVEIADRSARQNKRPRPVDAEVSPDNAHRSKR